MHAFQLADTFDTPIIGFETTSLHEFIERPLADAMVVYINSGRAKFDNYKLVPLVSRKGKGIYAGEKNAAKKARVGSLLQYYRRGEVYHNVVGTANAERILLGFPLVKEADWDTIDIMGYLPTVLKSGGIFFEIMENGKLYEIDSVASTSLTEDNYELGEWRLV